MTSLIGKPVDRRISIEGQSNAVGYYDSDLTHLAAVSDSTLSGLAAATFQRVYIFNLTSGNYENLKIGTNNMAQDSTRFGPEFGIAVRWMRETVAGNLFIDKNAAGGQPISYFMEGTSVFTALLANTAAQNAWLSTNKKRPVHMGWIWVQGESDYASTQASYEAQLTTYITSRLNNNLQANNGFCILPQVPSNSSQYGSGVAAAKTHYASLNAATTKIIQYGQLGGDLLHMNARGMVQMAYDAYSVLFSRSSLVLA